MHDVIDDWVSHHVQKMESPLDIKVKRGRSRTGGAAQVGVTFSLVEAEVGVLVEGVAGGALRYFSVRLPSTQEKQL